MVIGHWDNHPSQVKPVPRLARPRRPRAVGALTQPTRSAHPSDHLVPSSHPSDHLVTTPTLVTWPPGLHHPVQHGQTPGILPLLVEFLPQDPIGRPFGRRGGGAAEGTRHDVEGLLVGLQSLALERSGSQGTGVMLMDGRQWPAGVTSWRSVVNGEPDGENSVSLVVLLIFVCCDPLSTTAMIHSGINCYYIPSGKHCPGGVGKPPFIQLAYLPKMVMASFTNFTWYYQVV